MVSLHLHIVVSSPPGTVHTVMLSHLLQILYGLFFWWYVCALLTLQPFVLGIRLCVPDDVGTGSFPLHTNCVQRCLFRGTSAISM